MREESQHRDVRRMTNVVSGAITGPQINSLSKFIIHLPSASCHKPCNMTPLKFVLTSTPGGLSSLPPTIPTHTHTHTPSFFSLLMEQAEPLMLKRLQLSVSRLRGVLHWGLSPLSTSYKLSLLHSKNPPPTGGFTRLCVTIKAENSDYSLPMPTQKLSKACFFFFMIIFVNILKINVSI